MNDEIKTILEKFAARWTNGIQTKCIDSEKKLPPFDPTPSPANEAGFAKFNQAFMDKHVLGVMAAMTGDPIFDAPNPQPDGTCIQGQILVGLFWEFVFLMGIDFGVEEVFVTGNRAVVRWYATRGTGEDQETLRGCDIFYLENGKVAAKLTYSKAESFLGITLPT